MKKRFSIIYLVKKRKRHKIGIEVPKSIAQAYALYKKNGNTLWSYSIAKEINYVSPAFKKLDNGKIIPIGYQQVNCHMIFDVKMEDFRRKDRLVAGGHVT